MPDLRVISAGPVRVFPSPQPPAWKRLLTVLHLPGGVMAAQNPTIVSAEFTNIPTSGGYATGDEMIITAVAKSLNTTNTPYSVPVTVADTVVTTATSTATATAALATFNQLAGSIKDATGRTWAVGTPTFDASTGAWTCELTSTA